MKKVVLKILRIIQVLALLCGLVCVSSVFFTDDFEKLRLAVIGMPTSVLVWVVAGFIYVEIHE